MKRICAMSADGLTGWSLGGADSRKIGTKTTRRLASDVLALWVARVIARFLSVRVPRPGKSEPGAMLQEQLPV